jgi:ribose/xylose/arabinose/galactoside ABC-type transport system permease subunit
LASIQKSILGSETITLPYKMTSALKNAEVPLMIFIGFFIFCTILFHFTGLGRKLRYLGINELCAELTGFKKSRYLLLGFIIAGIGVGGEYGVAIAIMASIVPKEKMGRISSLNGIAGQVGSITSALLAG